MRKSFLICAAIAACGALSLTACASAPTAAQVDNAIVLAQAGFAAAKTTVQADASAGIIKADTARQIDGYITAGDQLLAGAQAAFDAGDAKTEQDKVTALIKLTADINNAVLIAAATYSQH